MALYDGEYCAGPAKEDGHAEEPGKGPPLPPMPRLERDPLTALQTSQVPVTGPDARKQKASGPPIRLPSKGA